MALKDIGGKGTNSADGGKSIVRNSAVSHGK